MGLRSWLKRTFTAEPAHRFNYESEPYSILLRGMFGQDGSGRTFSGRASALEIPAVLRGRNLICGISTLPLEAVGPDNIVVDHPLLRQIDPNVANIVTIAQTVEDLLFESVAWWRITAFSADGYPASAIRYEPGQVSLQPPANYQHGYLPSGHATEGVIWMAGKPVPWAEVIRFDSPNPPLIDVARRAVIRAIALDVAAETYARTPRPMDYFSPSDPFIDPFADPEFDLDALLDRWAEARRKRSTAFVPGALKYNEVQQPTPADLQLVQLQQRVSLEIANAMGIDPEDLGLNTTSRTYQNQTDRRKDRINDTLSPYMGAITQRLSMPDVTKRNVRVRFYLDDYMRADPRTRAEVDQIYIRNGVVSREFVAAREGLPPSAVPERSPEQEKAEQALRSAPLQAEIGSTERERSAPEQNGAEMSEPAAFTFARVTDLSFDAEAEQTFSVELERRTITGLAVPWNQHASRGGMKWRFERGSVKWKSINRVKLLRDHDNSQAVGKAVRLEDTPEGLMATFQVVSGPVGDQVLALAAEGVLDGLSIGVDFREEDFAPDPLNRGVQLVRSAALREVSLTAMPAFDDSRLTSVRASEEEEGPVMPEETKEQGAPASPETPTPAPEQSTPAPAPAPAPAPNVTFSAEQFANFMKGIAAPAPAEVRPVVNPTARPAGGTVTFVNEPLPYRFAYEKGRTVFSSESPHQFSADVFSLINSRGSDTDAEKRINALIKATFDTDTTDLAGVIPKEQRPDLWQPQMDYKTPLWDMINSGTTDGTPFELPKYNSSSGLVTAATEGTEPAPGAFTVTTQTVTPTQLWGKVEITRQLMRRGGRPEVSGIIWDQMLREYYEDREAAVATFLNTLTAATDITLTAGAGTNAGKLITVADLEGAIALLQFARGGNNFRAFAVHVDLYKVLASVTDSSGRPLYPILGPQNANGQASNLFGTLNIAGTTAVPAWALGATGTAAANSWLFDPAKVRGWANAPERLMWDFGATVQTANIPQLSHVTMGIYGDLALANLDINGVRQVIYDPVA